jgi:uncharacterized membrane protein YfcA
VLLALPIGMLIGLSLGSLGGGGSILTVPALVYLLSVSPHSATTASLVIVAITSLVGVAAHLRAGRVQVRLGIVFGVLGAGGAFVGSRLSASINPDVLLAAFSVVMVGAAVTMLSRRQASAVPSAEPRAAQSPLPMPAAVTRGDRAPSGGVAVRHRPALARSAPPPLARTARVSPFRVVIAATVVGLVTGFFGVGGGFVVVPALVLALSFDMPTAVGTSLLVIAINSASALLFRLGAHVHIGAALLLTFTAAAVVGAVAGSWVAPKIRPDRLVGAFAVLMIVVAIYTAVRSVPPLL